MANSYEQIIKDINEHLQKADEVIILISTLAYQMMPGTDCLKNIM